MGDRANVEIKSAGSSVFLYTHWQGEELPHIVQKALKRRLRWDDPQYLARIVFCQMISTDNDPLGKETGYGISAIVGDGNDKIVSLDVDTQMVSWKGKTATFEAFASGKVPVWDRLFNS